MYPGTYDWTGFFLLVAAIVVLFVGLVGAGILWGVRTARRKRNLRREHGFSDRRVSSEAYNPTSVYVNRKDTPRP
jgi:hypothetical protein